MNNNIKNYIYATGKIDEERLRILNAVYNENSQLALSSVNLQTKKCVIDIGCGQGDMLHWLAKNTSTDCTIVGVDNCAKQLAIAAEKNKNYSNIIYLQKDIKELKQADLINLNIKPDLIYCRWLLMHLPIKSITSAIKNIFQMLAPEGIAILEDVAIKNQREPPKALNKYFELFIQLAAKVNVDYNVGANLEKIMHTYGFSQCKQVISRPVFTTEQKFFFQLDLISAAKHFKDYNICSSTELENICADLASDKNNDFTMQNHICIGYKNSA